MTREEIIAMFRVDNPAITERVMGDPQLHNLCEIGDKEICAETRCIVTDFTIDSTVTSPVSVYSARYDLTAEEDKFYDIDNNPGGGVSYDDNPLGLTSVAELDEQDPNWRTRPAGDPDKYYRRGRWLYFDRPIETADDEIRVYAVLISDDFDDNSKTPYNQLTYLEPYHYGIVLFLQKKAKMKVGSKSDELKALSEYNAYIQWMKRMITGGKAVPKQFRPTRNRYSTR